MHVRLRRWVNSDVTFNILVGVLYIAIISAFTYLQVREDKKKKKIQRLHAEGRNYTMNPYEYTDFWFPGCIEYECMVDPYRYLPPTTDEVIELDEKFDPG